MFSNARIEVINNTPLPPHSGPPLNSNMFYPLRHIISGFVLLKIRCSGNPSTSPRPWKCGDSKSAVINVTHGNPQLHHDQPGCHFLFCLSLTDSCQQSFVLLLLFVIVPNLGFFKNQTYSNKNKNGSVTILMKLLVTMSNQSELNFGFTVSRGSR